MISTTLPYILGGIIILCSWNRSFSQVDPMTSPPVTMSPILKPLVGVKSQFLCWSREGTSTPLGTKTLPELMAMVSRGLWIPSKMVFKIPTMRKVIIIYFRHWKRREDISLLNNIIISYLDQVRLKVGFLFWGLDLQPWGQLYARISSKRMKVQVSS